MKKIALFACGIALGAAGCTPAKVTVLMPDLPEKTAQEVESSYRERFSKLELTFTRSDPGAFKADSDVAVLLLSADPFVWRDLKLQNRLQCGFWKEAPRGLRQELREAQSCSWGVFVSLGILFFDPARVDPQQLPQRWAEVAAPHWRGKIYWPSAERKARLGSALEDLRRRGGQGWMSEAFRSSVRGGGAADAALWMGLSEDALEWGRVGRKVHPLYPLDGVVAVPTRLGILQKGKDEEATDAVARWFFSSQVQNILARAGYYPGIEGMVTLDGFRPWSELKHGVIHWANSFE